jgi:hypothetical protein
VSGAVELIEHIESPREFVLIRPGHYPPREGRHFQFITDDVEYVLPHALHSHFLAIDLETKGNDYSSDIEIIGIGLAWDTGSCYFPYSLMSEFGQQYLIDSIYSHPRLVAHNVYFDGGVLFKHFNAHPNWYACSLAAYMQCANEGWTGQKWGLKDAQVDVLHWASSNETELDEWLVANGFYKGNRRVNDDPNYLIQEYRENNLSPEKGEMWRAPVEILGKYCCLDAEACYLLFTEVLAPVLQQFPALEEHHCGDFLYLIQLLIEQKVRGIPVNRDGMKARRNFLLGEIEMYENAFLKHIDTVTHIWEMEQALLSELHTKQPEQFRKVKERSEPNRYKKDGTVSKNWLKWSELQEQLPEQSKNWENWKERWDRAEGGFDPNYRFNINSGPQLRELLYTRLGCEVRIVTETGLPAVGTKAFKHMGELGSLLSQRAYLTKELSYIEDYLERTEHRDTLHPGFRCPGTVTGRLSSKEPNLQQVPKSKAVMSLFTARPGYVWIDLDFSALEPVVTTEFSGDENMQLIYGNSAPLNDIYLFVGANIPGEIGRKIRATGYNPKNPTPEALAKAKKECKHERGICKTVVLACAYGAGVNKVNQTLENDDIFLPFPEVQKIHSTYWKLFSGIRDLSDRLLLEWKENGGYIVNGVGRPMCVAADYEKDILNRFIQSTGHDLLVKYVRIYTAELNRRGIEWHPLIIDLHDSTAVEVPERHMDEVVEVMKWGVDELNRQLQGTIQLRGEPDIGINLAEIKRPEE